ncbi:MAG: hypothetical protein ACUZ8O_14090 [Candidatus Anammoxibacter sp.]
MIKERDRKLKEDKKKRAKVGTKITLAPKDGKVNLYSDEKLQEFFRSVPGGAKAIIVGTFRREPDDIVYDSYEIETKLKGEECKGWISPDNAAVKE